MMKTKKGKVYLIGAGPGDPELISLKGFNRLKEADVVLYDFLASRELLKFVKPDAEIICVGKQDGMHLLEQSAINQILYNKAKLGKIVVRLKGGDPLVFSRGIEEALFLKKKNINFEVIQGITSAFAAPESFGIPLTRKGKLSSIAVLTGRKSNGEAIDAPRCDTLVYLMAVNNIKEVIKAILASGKPNNTPCAFIEKATTSGERIVKATLATIVEKAQTDKIQPPAVFIVGKVINYGKKIYGHKFK